VSEPALRPATDGDWDAILAVANEALPQAPDGNAGWLDARKRFAGHRTHYVAESDADIFAYGGIEYTDGARWRLFVVMSPAHLGAGLGDRMLDQLSRDASELGAATLWMREQADDTPVVSFARARGFTETQRFVVRDGSVYDGVEVVELERSRGD
jgi:GNAT superfamily N-acetyltransferase